MTEPQSTSEIQLSGGCYCGAVHYTIKTSTAVKTHTFCHCSTCQSISGSAFLPFVHFAASEVHFKSEPQSALKTYEASKFAERQFCGICGSTLSMRYHAAEHVISLVVGSFDQESTKKLPRPTEHIYLCDKADWFELNEGDGTAKYDTMKLAAAYLGGNQGQSA